MVLSAMDRHSKNVNDDHAEEGFFQERRATLALARARAALKTVGAFESSALIRVERDARSPEEQNNDGEVIPRWR
jgi:hypothetical protein